MSAKQPASPFNTVIASLATFTLLVWVGVGVKIAFFRDTPRQMARVRVTTSRPAPDRAPELAKPVPPAIR